MSTNNGQEHRPQNSNLVHLKPAWKPGQSGNPGGRPKGTPSIPVIIARMLAMTPDEWIGFQPANAAEQIALQRVKDAARDCVLSDTAIKATALILDRLEGKPIQRRADVTVDEVVTKARLAYQLGLRIRDNIAAHCQQIACSDDCATRLQALIPPDNASVLEAVLSTVDEQYHEAVVRELGEG